MFGSAPRRGDRNVGISPPPVISVECGRGFEVLPPHYDSTNAPCAELDHLVAPLWRPTLLQFFSSSSNRLANASIIVRDIIARMTESSDVGLRDLDLFPQTDNILAKPSHQDPSDISTQRISLQAMFADGVCFVRCISTGRKGLAVVTD